MLKLVGGDAREFVKTEEDGLHIRMPAGLDKPLPVGVAPRFRIHGDFEITASYAIVKADKPVRGYGLAVTLCVETDTDNAEAVTIERGIIPKEGERFTSTRISGPPPPETRKYDVKRAVRPVIIRQDPDGAGRADGDHVFCRRHTALSRAAPGRAGARGSHTGPTGSRDGMVRPRRRDPPGRLDHPCGGFSGYAGAPLNGHA